MERNRSAPQPAVAAHGLMVRALIPPLTIALAALSAAALFLTATAITPPPLSGAEASLGPLTAVVDARPVELGFASLGQSGFAAVPPAPAVVDLARLIYAPGAGGRHTLPGPLLLTIESGTLTVQLDDAGQDLPANSATTQATDRLVLHTGDSLALPTATAAAFRNAGSEPVVALAAGVFPAGVAASKFGRVGLARWAEDWSPGASVQPLAGGWLADSPPLPATIALQRVSLRPGDQAPLMATGPVDLAVETGALTLESHGGLVWQQHPTGADQYIAPAGMVTLLPDDAALLQEEASVILRNAGSGPVLVLLLSVGPDRDSTGVVRWATPVAANPDPHAGLPPRYWPTRSATPVPHSLVASSLAASAQARHEVDPQRYLAQMTAMQHRRGLPLPSADGRLQSLVISATPVAPSTVLARR